jgi:hypothetical protein
MPGLLRPNPDWGALGLLLVEDTPGIQTHCAKDTQGIEFKSRLTNLPPKEPLHAMSPAILAPDAEIVEPKTS